MCPDDLAGLSYRPAEISAKREKVRRALLKDSPHLDGGRISRIEQSDLERLFYLYDHIFFKGYFLNRFSGQIRFSLSPRMTKSAGKTICPQNIKALSPQEENYELRISVLLLFSYGSLEGDKMVGGIKTRDSLEALQLVFEHEICHLIELHCFKKTSCRQARFRSMAGNLFGHTESYHQLPHGAEIAQVKYGLAVGDRVSFQVEGENYTGVISRITRRATVMVPHSGGNYRDGAGKRYHKFYVPLPLLQKCRTPRKS